jgi:hypothetical protein
MGPKFLSHAGRFLFIQVPEVWIPGNVSLPLHTGSRYAQVPFKTGLTVLWCTLSIKKLAIGLHCIAGDGPPIAVFG